MKKSLIARLNVCRLLFAAVCLWISSTSANAQSTIWEILPFPDSDWGGSHGQPATTNGNVVTLQGRPVRTVQSFSGTLKISYDVVLQARTATDGNLEFFFVPTGLPTNVSAPGLELLMQYENLGSDNLAIASNNTTYVWGYTPFTLSAQTVYHCEIDVSAGGGLTWIVNTLTNSLPSTIKVPYSSYQLELAGWQPNNVWQVSNFAVVPEPATIMLVAFGLGWVAAVRRRKSR